MKVTGITIKVGMILALVLSATVAWAELPQYVTEDFGDVLESEIGEVEGNWVEVSSESRVQINVVTKEVMFNLVGLPTNGKALAKGILVCQASGEASRVDTPGVPVNAKGVANFSGKLELPEACATAPNDIAFFVRTFANPNSSFVVWN